MLEDLARLMPRIAAGDVDEAAVYRRERAGERADARYRRPGALLCPICGTSAARFLPFGLFGRPNARCPGCGSVERHRFLWLWLFARTKALRTPLAILHTAPEPCLAARLRPLHGPRYVTVDRFDPAADLRADLARLPLPDGAFDLVISSHTLEHVADDRGAMAEMARVLRPGGTALLMFPYDARRPTREDPAIDTPAARMAAYGHPWHLRIYGTDVVDRIRAAGLEPMLVDSRRFLSGHRRRRHRVNANHLFVCRRGLR